MRVRFASTVLAVSLIIATGADAELVSKQVGRLTITADTAQAFPGGLLVARLHPAPSNGAAFAQFEGRRYNFFPTPFGLRALVPIPLTTPAGTAVLGIDLWTGRRRRRLAMDVPISERRYASRQVDVPEHKRYLLGRDSAVRDSRLVLAMLKIVTARACWTGPFAAPVGVPPLPSFGLTETSALGLPINQKLDGNWGERHRGLDYPATPGTLVQAPAAGTVVLARVLTATGQTILIDHGQGVMSAFFHLGRIDVRDWDWVEARKPIARSGDSGIAAAPMLHWGVYIKGVAIDPRVLMQGLE
jgi:hypothetical protein